MQSWAKWLLTIAHTCIGRALSSTHSDRVMHICVRKLTIIRSDNGLSPGRHQAINWTNVGTLSIGQVEQTSVKSYRNSYIFIHKNVLENVVRKLATVLPRPRCVKPLLGSVIYTLKYFYDSSSLRCHAKILHNNKHFHTAFDCVVGGTPKTALIDFSRAPFLIHIYTFLTHTHIYITVTS